MASKTVVVPNISCEHCTHTIKMELEELAGVTKVDTDLASKQVSVEYTEPADWEEIESLLEEINYSPQK